MELSFTSFIPSKNIPWLFTEKSGHQKRSGIQLKIIINSPVWLGQSSPFPSLLSHPITSFSLVVPQKTLLLPTTALVPFPLSSLGTFPPLPRPSQLIYGASLQDCSLWHWAWGCAIKRGISRHLHSEVNDEECEPYEHLFPLFSRGPSIYSWFSSTQPLPLTIS